MHDYGDVCQAITELAVEMKVPVTGKEFQLLNLCLDDAIAGAVEEHARQRELDIRGEDTERLGELAHELRNLVNAAVLAFESIKRGGVAVGGSTGAVLGRSLTGLRDLIDRSLADVRLNAGVHRVESISVADFIAEVEIGAHMHAASRGVDFTTPRCSTWSHRGRPPGSAVGGLEPLQNAISSPPRRSVSLTPRARRGVCLTSGCLRSRPPGSF